MPNPGMDASMSQRLPTWDQAPSEVLFNKVPAGVALLDRDLRYVRVSDRWCTDYSVNRGEILGRSHYEVFPDIPDRWKEMHRRAFEGEILHAEEDLWDRASGRTWVRWEIHPWKIEDGSVGGIYILAENITRLKQMEEALTRVNSASLHPQPEARWSVARDLRDNINARLTMLAQGVDDLAQNPPQSVAELGRQLGDIKLNLYGVSRGFELITQQMHSPAEAEHFIPEQAEATPRYCPVCGNHQVRRDMTLMPPFHFGAIRSTLASFRCEKGHSFFMSIDVIS